LTGILQRNQEVDQWPDFRLSDISPPNE